ncbi:acetyl-CoA carboxylase biotin carboxyl carrier protein subunit [Dactylosporangium aurantiacum]|uniref:Biotin carboxyl carrier protein of acetyl-CoA carboxylase n=1 Tax=Dactylosporangium aurantiacum TaxID=35754 RepID=A0A9Q9MH87_9ACTN|nr:biotin/lipoyl-containing protein [Dactylosporangium aurantiacum]MDG6101804.1 acetyl-CoA carboxylase biotin carboxyl carrier protein subunit [Dactylosporangium aurantiacum]UWZ52391.1 acetyl-CoA carboxylase biotin carboxyl carrier protein subunit [Dactylosporangium aurantiacum]
MTTTADTNGRRTTDTTDRRPAEDGASSLVHALREAAAAVGALLDRTGPRPQALTVRAGDVAIDIAWPGAPSAAPAPPPAAASNAPATAHGPAAASQAADAPREPTGGRYVTAPTVGTFYRAPTPGGAPFVEEHGTVVAGQQVAIVEAMKLMIPVEAELSGRIVRVCRQDGDPVEYGEPLFEVAPL